MSVDVGTMTDIATALPTLAELTSFVHGELCRLDALEPDQTPLFTSKLTRGGRSAGLLFHIEGPRLLRTSAVWSADEHRILIYDSKGTRVRTVRLSEAPELATA